MLLAILPLYGTSLASLILASPIAPVAGDVPIEWAGEALASDDLPESLVASAREAIEFWLPWAATHEYRIDLVQDGRVLLLTYADKKGAKRAAKNLKVIHSAIEFTDGVLPLPASRQVGETGAASEDDGSYEWGNAPLESQTAVLIEIDEEAHLAAAIDKIVAEHGYLASWGGAAKSMSGFVLERPLVAAWQPKIGIKEDYEGNPTNEMVNRLSQMMTLRRFGRQPYWLSMGIAWQCEMDQLDGVFCFPYRSGFVSAYEHTKWDKLLENRFKKRDEPLRMAELTSLKRGLFDSEAAQNAWGVLTFLSKHHPDALSRILDELHEAWDEKGRTTHSDGSWERIPDFEPSDADQLTVFDKHVPNFLTELKEFFAKGKRYKPGS